MFNDLEKSMAQIIQQAAEGICARVQSEMKVKPNYKLVYSESEAAEFLGIRKSQLQIYRREKLINYIEFPSIGQQFDEFLTEDPKPKRNGLYSYSLCALLDFAERCERLGMPRKHTWKSELTR